MEWRKGGTFHSAFVPRACTDGCDLVSQHKAAPGCASANSASTDCVISPDAKLRRESSTFPNISKSLMIKVRSNYGIVRPRTLDLPDNVGDGGHQVIGSTSAGNCAACYSTYTYRGTQLLCSLYRVINRPLFCPESGGCATWTGPRVHYTPSGMYTSSGSVLRAVLLCSPA